MTMKKKSPAQLDREIADALGGHATRKRSARVSESQEMKDLREAKARYLRALDYAGNTPEQVRDYHKRIDEISAKMRTLVK